MTTRHDLLAKRITQGRAFGQPASVVIQAAGGRNAYGEWEPGATASVATVLATTPLPGAEREEMPEAARLSDARVFWLTSVAAPIRVGTEETAGDVLEYNGVLYRALRTEQWPGYWRVIAVRGEQDNA